jgi:hypothetical protein
MGQPLHQSDVYWPLLFYLVSEDNTSIKFYKSQVAQRGHVNEPVKDDARAMIHLGTKSIMRPPAVPAYPSPPATPLVGDKTTYRSSG